MHFNGSKPLRTDTAALGRRRFAAAAVVTAGVGYLAARSNLSKAMGGSRFNEALNAPRRWPIVTGAVHLDLTVSADAERHAIDRRVFGTNLEWFNDAGGFADGRLTDRLVRMARQSGATAFRFPGGTLADYYRWADGTGPASKRPSRRHPTDPGSSRNSFGSPELFRLLSAVGGEALLTVNAGTGSADEAADWVAYCNRPDDARRKADGFERPIGVNLWEIGNELYLPGNPGEVKVGTTPQIYAQRYIAFSDAMRAVDPTITAIGIGVAPRAHVGPGSAYPEWSEVLLQQAASRLDMIAVHNAYFPILLNVKTPPIETVYPALWAAPDAVERSLSGLSQLIARYEGQRKREIGIAVTEWGTLFSLPQIDPYWTDHVKTLGSSVYLARLLQVMIAQPRVRLANHFKFVDRSFMGSIDFEGRPKLPFHVLNLFAAQTGSHVIESTFGAVPTYDTDGIGNVGPERNVPEVTALASRDQANGRVFVNLVNRSLRTAHPVHLTLRGMQPRQTGVVHSISAAEPTAHNGRDIPPEWPYDPAFEPYSSSAPDSIVIRTRPWILGAPIVLPPFSIATLVIDEESSSRRTRERTGRSLQESAKT